MSALGTPRPSPLPAPPPGAPTVSAPEPQEPRSRKWIVWLVLILVGGLVVWQAAVKPRMEAQAERASAVSAIKAAKVFAGTLARTVRVSGPTSSQEYTSITAPIMRGPEAGRELTLLYLVDSGKIVKKGELIAQIDAKTLEDHIDDIGDDIERAEADVRKRRAEQAIETENLTQTIRVAQAELDKAILEEKASETRTVIDRELLKLAVEEAQARLNQTKADVAHKLQAHKSELRILEITKERHVRHRDRHKTDLVKFKMYSPMDGLAVVQMTWRGGEYGVIRQGDNVTPGMLFLKVVNPAKMQVEGQVNQSESSLFRIGQKARIRLDAFPELNLAGKVHSIGALAAGGWRQSYYIRNVPVRITFTEVHNKVIPDLSAAADVTITEEENVKQLALAAVRREEGKDVVYVRKGDQFERREVKLGLSNNTHAAVLSGLEVGEEVALEKPAIQMAALR